MFLLTSQMSVSVGGKNLKNTIVNSEDTDIKSTTTEVKDKNILLTTFLVQTICDGSGCRFIDNPSNIKASNDTSILGGLPLGVIEVGCKFNNKLY